MTSKRYTIDCETEQKTYTLYAYNTQGWFMNRLAEMFEAHQLPETPAMILWHTHKHGIYTYGQWTITDHHHTPKDSPQDTAQNPPTETSHRTTARGQAHTTRTHEAVQPDSPTIPPHIKYVAHGFPRLSWQWMEGTVYHGQPRTDALDHEVMESGWWTLTKQSQLPGNAEFKFAAVYERNDKQQPTTPTQQKPESGNFVANHTNNQSLVWLQVLPLKV